MLRDDQQVSFQQESGSAFQQQEVRTTEAPQSS